MGGVTLGPELIEAFTKKAVEAGIKDRFVESDVVVANHVLFEQFKKEFPYCPKIVFYIWMDQEFGMSNLKDDKGNLGRKLKFQ